MRPRAHVIVAALLVLALSCSPAAQRPSNTDATAAVTPAPPAAAETEEAASAPPASDVIPAPSDLAAVRRFRSVRPAQTAPPTAIAIPAIGVRGRLDRTGLRRNGELQVPEFGRMSWYAGGVRPGQQGPAAILGHVDTRHGADVFFNLHKLRRGDKVRITRADDSNVVFVVDVVERYAKDDFPTRKVWFPTDDAQLRLITCGGDFDRRARSYRDNVVVFASLRA